MRYSRKALLAALQTRLGSDYMRAWDEINFCAIPELCVAYSKYAFVFLGKYCAEPVKYDFSEIMADYVVRIALEELQEKGYLEFGKEDNYAG